MPSPERIKEINEKIQALELAQKADAVRLKTEQDKLEELKKTETDPLATKEAQAAHKKEKIELLEKLIAVEQKLEEIRNKKATTPAPVVIIPAPAVVPPKPAVTPSAPTVVPPPSATPTKPVATPSAPKSTAPEAGKEKTENELEELRKFWEKSPVTLEDFQKLIPYYSRLVLNPNDEGTKKRITELAQFGKELYDYSTKREGTPADLIKKAIEEGYFAGYPNEIESSMQKLMEKWQYKFDELEGKTPDAEKGGKIEQKIKEEEIDTRIVITGTSGGFTSFDDGVNSKNNGAGSTWDVRPANDPSKYDFYNNYEKVSEKWNGGGKPFTFTYTRDGKKYLYASAGLGGSGEGGRYGNVFVSIELTEDLPNWTEEYILKKAIDLANEKFGKDFKAPLEFKEEYLSKLIQPKKETGPKSKPETDNTKKLEAGPTFYMGEPYNISPTENVFPGITKQQEYREGFSMFKFNRLGDSNKAQFEIMSDNDTIHVLQQNAITYIRKACRFENEPSINTKKVVTVEPGEAELQSGGNWKITKRSLVRFINADDTPAKKENKIETTGNSELEKARTELEKAGANFQNTEDGVEYLSVLNFLDSTNDLGEMENYRAKNRKTLSQEAKDYITAYTEVQRIKQARAREEEREKEKVRELGAISYEEYKKKFFYFDEGAGTSFTESKGENLFSYDETTGNVLPCKEGWKIATGNPSYYLQPFFTVSSFDVYKEPLENLRFVPMKLDKKGRFVEIGKILLPNEEE